MKDALKFCVKAFFGGFIGCIGALTLILILALIFGLVLAPKIMGGITSLFQSFQESLSHLIPSLTSGGSMLGPSGNQLPMPPMEVFLTMGNNPDGKHITSFSATQTKQVYFWVRAPQGAAISFDLLMTMPDGKQTQFGPTFKTDASGKPAGCGQFDSQVPTGNYKLDVTSPGSSTSAGSVGFTVTK
jgi:hypothetical protein